MQFAEAANVNEGQRTSSPGLKPARIQAICNATVQLDTASACFTFHNSQNVFSSSSHFAPADTHFDFIVSYAA